jgi:outer membrane protein assembly factor BamB
MGRCARLAVTTFAVLLILLAAPVGAFATSAWPMFGHDAAHSRRSQYAGAQSATLKWARTLTTYGWIMSSPAIAADGTVYATLDDYSHVYDHQQLFALDPSTGSTVWQTDAGDAHGSSPAVDADGCVYLGGNLLSAPANQRGKVFAFASTGGSPLWTYSTWDAFYSSPTVAGGAIFIGCDDGNLDSLSPLGDHLNWGMPINGNSSAVESSPAVDGVGALYVGGAGKMVSLETTSPGNQRWSVPTSGTGYYVESSPALSNDGATVYFADDEGTVYALATSDGAVRWTHTGLGSMHPTDRASSPGVGPDGTIYIGGGDGKVYALKASDGSTKWACPTGGPVFSSPAIDKDGTVYIGSDDYKVYALNGATGAVKWSYATGAPVSSSPAIGADGTIYVGSEDGKLYAIGGEAPSPTPTPSPAPSPCTLSTPKTSGALKHGVAVTYSGTLNPARVAKVKLTFQRKKGRAWKAAFTASVSTRATGAWTYKKKLGAATYRLCASTTATAAYKAATSKWKTVVIK